MPYSLRLIAPAVCEPVSLPQAKQHLHLEQDFTEDDALISAYISAARLMCEQETRRVFFNQTFILTLDSFPWFRGYMSGTAPASNHGYMNSWQGCEIKLPRPSCVSVESITFLDATGAVNTVPPTSYFVDVMSEPARIVPMYNTWWSTAPLYLPGSVQITYTAGTFGDGLVINTIPATIQIAILLLVGHFYANREATSDKVLTTIPLAVDSLLAGYVYTSFGLEAN